MALAAAAARSTPGAICRAAGPHVVVGVGGYSSGPVVLRRRAAACSDAGARAERDAGPDQPAAGPRGRCRRGDLRRGAAVVPGQGLREREPGAAGVLRCSRGASARSRGRRPARRAGLRRLAGRARDQRRRWWRRRRALRRHAPGAGDHPPDRRARPGRRCETAYRRAGARRRGSSRSSHDMDREMRAADLVVCRAGATTLAELTAAGRPALLIPLPTATDDHQRRNAEALARGRRGRGAGRSRTCRRRRSPAASSDCWPTRPRRAAMAAAARQGWRGPTRPA